MPTTGAPPVIETVEGNQFEDGSKIANGLLVTGVGLAGANFDLKDGGRRQCLSVRSHSDNLVEVFLPASVRQGAYTLVAVNQAGQDEADVTLVLPELSGNTLVDRINTESTTTFHAGVLPLGMGPTNVAAGDHNHSLLYYTKSEVDTAIASSGSGLVAGDGVGISGGIISVDATVARKNLGAGDQVFGEDLLAVSYSTNRVGVGTAAPQAELDVVGDLRASGAYTFAAPRTGYLSIAGASFSGQTLFHHYGYNRVGVADEYDRAYGVAAVNLPEGARITGMHCRVLDSVGGVDDPNLSLTLRAHGDRTSAAHNGPTALVEIARLSTNDFEAHADFRTLSAELVADATVNNSTYAYSVMMFAIGAGVLELALNKCTIEYETYGPSW